jgi:hypothetical protein
MGATSWRYYTPHRAEPEEALQLLRTEVFARGDYVNLTGSMEEKLRETYRRFGDDPDSPAAQARIDESLRLQRAVETGDLSGLSTEDRGFARRLRWFGWFARLLGAAPPARPGRPPASITELLEMAEECGTHSILDIEEVARRLAPGVAAPMTTSSLREVFGTTEPTHAQVEEHWADIAESLDRDQCRYLVIYQDGQPLEYAFIGCSGD